MQLQTRSKPAAAIPAANPDATRPAAPTLYTVQQFAMRQPAFTEAALRNMIFKADPRLGANGPIAPNGLIETGAVCRVGRKILLDESRFLAWVRAQSAKG